MVLNLDFYCWHETTNLRDTLFLYFEGTPDYIRVQFEYIMV